MPKQFHFESAWLLEDSYMDMLKGSWQGGALIKHNLENFHKEVKKWKWGTFDQVLRQKKILVARLAGIQNNMHNGNKLSCLKRLRASYNETEEQHFNVEGCERELGG
ncbi:hypothetical protein A2U01_0029138 [Trifolium medium]|uniref:Uncharacterized protein n=1 Tax=Trifolium medium TaxID=97028 RepID=A0A392P9X5_9FABA|nr:hypothetical protein [Trifolium medium]